MKEPAAWRGFYFITDAGLSARDIIVDTADALAAGVAMVQYREKAKEAAARREEAAALRALCRAAGVPFLVNDDVALARAVGADGVHLGASDMEIEKARAFLGPEAIIGLSTHGPDEARDAERRGADYVGVGPVFATTTKLDAEAPIGVEGVRLIRAATRLSLAAIGGINLSNAREVFAAGADMVCAISASLADGRVRENILEIKGCRG